MTKFKLVYLRTFLLLYKRLRRSLRNSRVFMHTNNAIGEKQKYRIAIKENSNDWFKLSWEKIVYTK